MRDPIERFARGMIFWWWFSAVTGAVLSIGVVLVALHFLIKYW